MSILITGVAGFIGSNVAREMVGMGWNVYGIDDLSFGDEANIPKGLQWHKGDFKDFKALDRVGTVIHCATLNINYGIDHPYETFHVNTESTIEFFLRLKKDVKIVYLSTSSVYNNASIFPTPETAEIRTYNAYDVSKRAVELYLQERGNYTTLRLTNVYGRNQYSKNPYCKGVIGEIIHAALAGEIFSIYGDGLSTRDYTYIDDVVTAIFIACNYYAQNTEINIGTGKESSVFDLIKLIENSGYSLNYKTTPGRPVDKITRRCLDIRKAGELLGWVPEVGIEEGIKRTIEYMKHGS